MGNTKIERLGEGAEALVHQGHAKGRSYRKIAQDVEQAFNEECSHQAIKNYLEAYDGNRLAELGAKNAEELNKREMEKILDVGSQLEKLNNKLNNALDNLDENEKQEIGIILKVSQELRKQLKFHREFVEQVTTPDTQVNKVEFNKTDVMMEFNEYLANLESSEALICEQCGSTDVLIEADKIEQ